MRFDVVAQVVSSLAVVVALAVNGYQVRQLLRQTSVMQQDVFGSLVASFTEQWIEFLLDRPDLLAWFLRTRGYSATSHEKNQQRLYALAKLNIHEGIYLQRLLRGIREESWAAWINVLRADLMVEIYREVWPNGRRFYDAGFVEHVDRLLAEVTESR